MSAHIVEMKDDTHARIMRLEARIAAAEERHVETCRQLWDRERWADPQAASALLISIVFDLVAMRLTRDELLDRITERTADA